VSPAGEFRVFFSPADYARSLAFYRDELGLAMTSSWDRGPADRGAVFRLGGGHVELVAHGPAAPPSGVGVYAQIDDLDAFHDRLVARGIALTRPLGKTSWGHRLFGVRDPDGVEIVVFAPVERSTAFSHFDTRR
jgi:uncharacterized glyoxalase superfamily protein PhnB